MNSQGNHHEPTPEDRFQDGFIDGFTRAREIFWRDLMRKAGECHLMIEATDNQSLKDNLSAMEASYRVSADLIARSHTVYPGALAPGSDPEDPRYTIKFEDNLFRY